MAILTKQRILKWFENHDMWIHQAERKERLGKTWVQKDKMLGITYHSREELDLKAEEMEAILNNPTLLAENEILAREEAKAWKKKIEEMRGAK